MSTDDQSTTTTTTTTSTNPAPNGATADRTELILAAVAAVAPELEPELAELDPDIDFWIEFGLDSMDHLSVMTRLAEETGIEIPEQDYPRLTTLNALRTYLERAG